MHRTCEGHRSVSGLVVAEPKDAKCCVVAQGDCQRLDCVRFEAVLAEVESRDSGVHSQSLCHRPSSDVLQVVEVEVR